MLNQLPQWIWIVVPLAVLAAVMWKQRTAPSSDVESLRAQVAELQRQVAAGSHGGLTPPAPRGESATLHSLQDEMLRGLLRKEGLLPATPPPSDPSLFACLQQFRIVPVKE